jgi:hypothetical protein
VSARVLAGALALALLVGCLDEQVTVTLAPDGQGRLTLQRTLGPRLAGEVEDPNGAAAAALASWEGVAAWSAITTATTASGGLRLEATGWFLDLDQVRRVAPGEGLVFALERRPGALEVGLEEVWGPHPADVLLERGVAALERGAALRRAQLDAALEGFGRRVFLDLPAEARAVEGAWSVSADRRERAALVWDKARLSAAASALEGEARVLARGVVEGTRTGQEARADLSKALGRRRRHRARCDVKPGAEAGSAFRAGLLEAVAAWRGSPWQERVVLARGAGAAPRGDAPLDRFEPNDSVEEAAQLEPGRHGGLICAGEDHYRLEVPAGRRVVASVVGEGGAELDLELHGPGGVARARGTTTQVEGLVLGRSATVGLRVAAEAAAYALQVELLDPPAADAHEPNGSGEQAAALSPGQHANLRCDGEDWYRVDAPAGAAVRVVLSCPPARGDLDLELFTADGRLLARSEGVGAEEQVVGVNADGGVRVRVHGAAARYALTVESGAAPGGDRFEPNDLPGLAAALALGLHPELECDGEDHYLVPLEAGQQLEVLLATAEPGLRVLAFEPGGEAVGLARPRDGVARLRLSGEAGAYRLLVYRRRAPYALELRATAPR